MNVLVWIAEATWPACVDTARALAPADSDVVLLHVTGPDVSSTAHGAFTGLLGRGRSDRDPGRRVDDLAAASAKELLQAAAQRLGRPSTTLSRQGHIEREVIAAAESSDLLVLARDGDRSRLGPKSLGPATRFVVDHARCPVLLVWPEPAPATSSLPPPPGEPR